MNWDNTDKIAFEDCIKKEVGQITPEDLLGKKIIEYAKNEKYSMYLEIGTWNGLGSTKCFMTGFENRTDYTFYSLECNREKSEFAKALYPDNPRVHILNEVLFNDFGNPETQTQVFPQLLVNHTMNYWNQVDIENMKNAGIFWNETTKDLEFDVVLLDGGEFTTYFEYIVLKDRCRNLLLLDDTNTDKCKLIVQEIKNDLDNWEIIIDDPSVRNGIFIAQKIRYLYVKC